MAKIYEDNSFAIGNTPLVKLKSDLTYKEKKIKNYFQNQPEEDLQNPIIVNQIKG